jgi:hypothetical protein
MTAITQVILAGAESFFGSKGKLSRFNSLVFSQAAAGINLSVGDNALMSSLSVSGLAPVMDGAFTIEYWVKFKNLAFGNGIVHQNGQAIIGTAGVIGGLALLHVANSIRLHNYLIINNNFTIPTQVSVAQTWQLDVWYYITLVKNASSETTLYVNGFRTPSGKFINRQSYNVSPTLIGTWRNTYGAGTTNNLIGNLFNLKYTVGEALHDPNLTEIPVPQRPNESVTANTKLLNLSPDNNAFADRTGLCTIGIRAGSVTQTKSTPFHDEPILIGVLKEISSPFSFQSGSLRFRGSSTSFATYQGSAGLNFGTGNFCIEWLSYSKDNNSESTIWWYGTTASPTLGIVFEDSLGFKDIKVYIGGSIIVLASIINNYANVWTHWAFVRNNGLLYLYRDGIVLNPLGVANTTDLNDSASIFYMGKKGEVATNSQCFGGFFTNLRITKGNAVYTGNFTRPTGNLTRIQNANRFGGSNTNAIRSYQVFYLMVP